jgi:hypothetical protein
MATAPLIVSANQNKILTAAQAPVTQNAATGLALVTAANQLLPAMVPTWASLSATQQQAVVNGLVQMYAPLLAALGIDQAGVGTVKTPATIGYTNAAGGLGTMTFVGGLLVAFT